IDHADERLRGGGDDLLARQRRAAALDQALVGVAFVGAVDVQRELAGAVEIDDADAERGQQRRALLRARHRGVDATLDAAELVDEVRDGRAGADADDAAVLDERDRLLRGKALLLFLVDRHHSSPRTQSHSDFVTGDTDSRLPGRSSTMSFSSL